MKVLANMDDPAPTPGRAEIDLEVFPTHRRVMESQGMPDLTRSFDEEGSDERGHPSAAACARAMHWTLAKAGLPSGVMIQCWELPDGQAKDRVTWQVEYQGQADRGNPAHVKAWRDWVGYGAPMAFVALLTVQELSTIQGLCRPVLTLEDARKVGKVRRVLVAPGVWQERVMG